MTPHRDGAIVSAVAIFILAAAILFVLQYVPWAKSEPRQCIYRPLEGRYCNEFPSDDNLTVMGATWPALSSLSMIVGGVVSASIAWINSAHLRGKMGALIAVIVYFIALGVVSFQYHRIHCKLWWRVDINMVRAFTYVVSSSLFFISFPLLEDRRMGLAKEVFAFCITGSAPIICVFALWDNTEDSSAIVALGAVQILVALFYMRVFATDRIYGLKTWWVTIAVLLVGGGFISLQTVGTFCYAQPVAIGHTIMGAVPLALTVLAIPHSSLHLHRPQFTDKSPAVHISLFEWM